MSKHIYKKIILYSIALAVFISSLSVSGCSSQGKSDSGKLSIVTTLFPQYDFARQIAGDKAEVTLLLKPGTEAHDYDPSAADMIKINDSDLFIYTGKYMEPWAETIVKSLDNKALNILDASEGVTLCKSEHEHSHDDAFGNDESDEDREQEIFEKLQGAEHSHEYDPHIWTSPKNAVIMIENIRDNLISIDRENEEYYKKNAENYIEKIRQTDEEIRKIVADARQDTVYFGGRFAMIYFVNEYGLHYESAFDSCSSETEPSAKLVAHMIDEMKKTGAKTVFYEELSSPKTAQVIADEAGGTVLLLHSCHNVSKEGMEKGVTYVSLMRQNMENLRIGLN